MDNPDIGSELNGIDNPVCVAFEWQRDFKHAGAESVQRFCYIRFATFGGNRERRQAADLCFVRELLEFPEC